jgi:hypothetical protein
MRNQLKEKNNEVSSIATSDFFLSNQNLDQTWDIFLTAVKG